MFSDAVDLFKRVGAQHNLLIAVALRKDKGL